MIKGIGKVYRFTLEQFFKGTANRLFLVFLLAVSLLMLPISTWFMQRTGGGSDGTLVEEMAEKRAEEMDQQAGAENGNEPVNAADPEGSAVGENAEAGNPEGNADGEIAEAGNPEAGAGGENAEAGAEEDEWSAALKLYQEAGLSEEQVAKLSPPPEMNYFSLEEYRDFLHAAEHGDMTESEETLPEEYPEEATSADGRFAVQYFYAILVLILSLFSTTYIIRAMVEEKASKLVETLLVSVDPLALIFGKILAVMTYVVCCFAILLVGMLISAKLTPLLMGVEAVNPLALVMGSQVSGLRVDAGSFVIIVISLLLGFLTFALIGAIAGSSCSSMDDVEHANLAAVWILLGGYMVSIFTSGFPGETISLVTSLVPFVSIFSAPVRYVLGHIGLPVLLLSWLLQAVIAALLALLCAKVYRGLIYYRGSRLKLGAMLKMGRKGA